VRWATALTVIVRSTVRCMPKLVFWMTVESRRMMLLVAVLL